MRTISHHGAPIPLSHSRTPCPRHRTRSDQDLGAPLRLFWGHRTLSSRPRCLPLPGSPLSFISLPETQEEAELIVQTDEGELEFHEEFIGSLPPTSESTPRELASSQSDLGGLHKHRISMSRVSSSNSDDHLAPPTLSSRPASTGSGSGSDSQRAVVEFEIEWIKTLPLPFKRTRHIRNVWNDNREVKISRDGTELDPIAGQLLVEAWYEEEQLQHNSAGQAGRRNGRRGRRRRGSQTLQRTPA